jgi:hypothetical protein
MKHRAAERSIHLCSILRFPPTPGLLTELAGIIEQEQVCCRFLRLQISIAPDAGAITLEVVGPPGTREMLRSLDA